MLDKILVPLDGSDLGDRILSQVRRLLIRTDAEVTLLRVLSSQELGEQSVAAGHIERVRRALAEQGARATSVVLIGDAAARILDHARDQKVALIAMSTRGRSGLSRAVRGSVAESVLRASPVPVLLANPGVREGEELRIKRILVPLDGSRVSAEILPLAVDVAKLYGSELVLAHPEDVTLGVGIGFGALSVKTTNARGEVERFSALIEGVPVRTTLTIGSPATAILELVKQENVDLVAMTTHGRSGFSRLAFGSVAEEVVRRCTCPLLVKRTLDAGIARISSEKSSAARVSS